MVTTTGLLYVAGVTALFFFWAYGIASFVRDLRRTYLPAVRRYWAARRERKRSAERDAEREDRKRQLF